MPAMRKSSAPVVEKNGPGALFPWYAAAARVQIQAACAFLLEAPAVEAVSFKVKLPDDNTNRG